MVLRLSEAQLIAFVLVNASGVEVAGLDDTFSVQISKDGGIFAASTGVKAEIGNGWYSYELTAAETDTAGPLAVMITGAGASQQNLLYEVSGTVSGLPSGPNILSADEAAVVLRCATDDADMLAILPLVDAYLQRATDRDWTIDTPIRNEAKAAARILLVRIHEDPGAIGQAAAALGWGLNACILQLQALARALASSGVPLEPLKILSSNIAGEMAIDVDLVLIFNHEMNAVAINNVRLETSAGIAVATTNTLDVTGKIMTISPDAALNKNTAYNIVLDHPADIYGQTLDQDIGFWTED